ncbi:MAG TPA: hypothetical protein H9680_02595 [Firmicutes bacterium]|nr:hypothetical protein [Bacillota bacterium]
MAIVSVATILPLVIFLVVVVGGILLEIFLARRESPWPGLVLPGITFLWSLVLVFQVAVVGTLWETIGALLAAFLTGNLSTLVLLLIYYLCRRRNRRKRQLERMNIQDLE